MGDESKDEYQEAQSGAQSGDCSKEEPETGGAGPVRGPEPPAKPRKKAKKKAGGQSSAGLKKIENRLVPGLNPPKGDMAAYIRAQQRQYA